MNKDFKDQIGKIFLETNYKGISDFEWYCPAEMHAILYHSFEENSIVSLKKAEPDIYKKIPFLNQVKYVLNILKENDVIKLTKKGNLKPTLVTEIYAQGFIKDEWAEYSRGKFLKEDDCMVINLTKHILLFSGLVKKRHNKLSLTKKGKQNRSDHSLFEILFTTMISKFNLEYYDGYPAKMIGQFGIGFTLILLKKYGNEKKMDSFYATQYFKAFPALLTQLTDDEYHSKKENGGMCYVVRSFDRFLKYFGLIKVEIDKSQSKISPKIYISKSEIFDELIKIIPPQNR